MYLVKVVDKMCFSIEKYFFGALKKLLYYYALWNILLYGFYIESTPTPLEVFTIGSDEKGYKYYIWIIKQAVSKRQRNSFKQVFKLKYGKKYLKVNFQNFTC